MIRYCRIVLESIFFSRGRNIFLKRVAALGRSKDGREKYQYDMIGILSSVRAMEWDHCEREYPIECALSCVCSTSYKLECIHTDWRTYTICNLYNSIHLFNLSVSVDISDSNFFPCQIYRKRNNIILFRENLFKQKQCRENALKCGWNEIGQ